MKLALQSYQLTEVYASQSSDHPVRDKSAASVLGALRWPRQRSWKMKLVLQSYQLTEAYSSQSSDHPCQDKTLHPFTELEDETSPTILSAD